VEPVVVYRAPQEWAQQAHAVLEEADLHPVILDKPGSIILQAAALDYSVRVAVPESEVARAREVLQDWNARASHRVHHLQSELFRTLLLSLIPPLIFIGVIWSGEGKLRDQTGAILLIWVAGVILGGVWQRRRDRRSV
jgi:hypothetical protein